MEEWFWSLFRIWEEDVLYISVHNYPEAKKVKFALIAFTNHAIMWWDQLVTNNMRNYEVS
jgi:hypothetical protein